MYLHSTKEAAAYLGGKYPLSIKMFVKWRHTGCGPEYLKLGSAVRYDQAKLDEWIEGQRRKSTSEYGSGSHQGGA